MDNSAPSWFSAQEMEDHFLSDQCDVMDSFEEDLFGAFGDDLHNCLPTKGNFSISPIIVTNNSTTRLCVSAIIEAPPLVTERPPQQQNPNGCSCPTIYNFSSFDQPSSSPTLLTFGTLNPGEDKVCDVLTSNGSFVKFDHRTTRIQKRGKRTEGRTRSPSQTYDHIMAERKRRKHLGQLFSSLSSILPGLKKMDKTSVLGDAINQLKHLQEKVKTLEEQVTKQTVESVVLVKKSCNNNNQLLFPQIEAKVCDKEVLLKVHCENQPGVLIKLLSEAENLNLAVTNTSVTPFGHSALEVTIIAEMEKEFNMTTKELAKNLGSALQLVAQES